MHRVPSLLSSLASVFRNTSSPSAAATGLTSTSRLGLSPRWTSLGMRVGNSAPFSTTPMSLKKKGKGVVKMDKRIKFIRYFLSHPKTPRPLRFSRTRSLRHWTIHRAWQLFRARQRTTHELELQRMQASMASACEELRTGAGDGGRLFRKAMIKKGVWKEGFPIEYAKGLAENPGLEGWNHGWKK